MYKEDDLWKTTYPAHERLSMADNFEQNKEFVQKYLYDDVFGSNIKNFICYMHVIYIDGATIKSNFIILFIFNRIFTCV